MKKLTFLIFTVKEGQKYICISPQRSQNSKYFFLSKIDINFYIGSYIQKFLNCVQKSHDLLKLHNVVREIEREKLTALCSINELCYF